VIAENPTEEDVKALLEQMRRFVYQSGKTSRDDVWILYWADDTWAAPRFVIIGLPGCRTFVCASPQV